MNDESKAVCIGSVLAVVTCLCLGAMSYGIHVGKEEGALIALNNMEYIMRMEIERVKSNGVDACLGEKASSDSQTNILIRFYRKTILAGYKQICDGRKIGETNIFQLYPLEENPYD